MRSLIIGVVAALGLPAMALAAPDPNPAAAPAGHYVLDSGHASVIAKVLHLGLSHYTMRITKLAGSYDYDPANPADSKIAVTLDARSLDAGNFLVSKTFGVQFLDSLLHPTIRFTSTAIDTVDADHGRMTGDLTFRGVTRPVTLDVTYNGYDSSLVGGQRMGFSAQTSIKRSDFGSTLLLSEVGDQVGIDIEAEFVRK